MRKFLLILSIATALLLPACNRGSHAKQPGEEATREMRHARNVQMQSLSDGVTLVTLRNPWDTTRTMSRYALVEKGYEAPADLPKGTVVVSVPLEKSVVYSGVHASLIEELGASQQISGVCDTEYIGSPTIREAIEHGFIADCGNSFSPNVEKIVSLQPAAIVLSPYEKSDEGARFARSGIPVVEAADYMEATPLGRAEWMRFYGRLYGKGAEADSLFSVIEKDYGSLKSLAASSQGRPKVLFDRMYGGMWDVPTSGSVTGHLIADAGGTNPFDKFTQGGSAHITAEEVLYLGGDADIWLVRYAEPRLSMKMLAADNPLYSRIKAYGDGNVFGANTLTTTLFEDGAFHPDKTLKEMVTILHPELNTADTALRYYRKLPND